MRPVTPVLVVVVAAALALAGCSDPEPGSPLPTSASSAGTEAPSSAPPSTGSAPPAPTTPTASTTSAATTSAAMPEPSATPVTAPTLPPEAMSNDAAGAEAFVRYWFEAAEFAYDSLDAGPLGEVSATDCDVCNQITTEVGRYQERGARVEGGAFALKDVVSPTPDSTGVVVVALRYEQEPYEILDDSGEVFSVEEGEAASLGAVLERVEEGDGWRMYGLGS